MSAHNLTELAETYWKTHDQVNALARNMRPSRSGPYNAEDFVRRAETFLGYKDYVKGAAKFQDWVADQRVAVQSRRPGVNPAFISEFPDQTGTRMTPALDLSKVEVYFRAHPEEFGKILTA